MVLAGRELRPDIDIETTARFGDPVWELTPALVQKHQRRMKLDFTTLPERYRHVAKELFHAKLTGDLPEGHRRPTIVSIRKQFTEFKIFADWLNANGQPDLRDITVDQVDAFRRSQAGRDISASWIGQLRRTVRDLWVFAAQLSDHLGFDPQVAFDDWHDRPGKCRPAENRTDRIPEPVLGPLLGWALRWVEELSVDILNARQEWEYMFARTWRRLRGHRGPGMKSAASEAEAVFDRYRRARRPLPAGPTGVNISHLARETGCHRSYFDRSHVGRRMLAQAVAELGVDDDAYLWTPMTVIIDGQRWLEKMPYRRYQFYEQRLNAACYIVIAFLSGMRDGEVKHLRRGCLRTDSSSDGRLIRHKLTSQTFKRETNPLGAAATWVVGAPVARAIAILEHLQPPEQQWLFAPLASSHHRGRHREGRTFANEVLSSRATNDDIAGFIAWINDYRATNGRADFIPQVQGRIPVVICSQFRRTLAWFIARRPGGSIAGAIAYRHHSVQMFEGYAGTSASGFRAEVEAECALARGEDLAVMVERHEHTRLAGPAADEAALRLREFGQHLRFAGAIPTDRRQLAKLMARHDPHVYPGRFVTCVHNPDRALCHNGSGTGPSLGDCQPLACRNVTLTDDNTTEWGQQIENIDQTLGGDGGLLAPYVRQRLIQRREQINKLLDDRPRP
ncbi:hypothetical protein ACIA59_24170 [Micromonospora haikouensis]|uniref:hypothetical protein n=1 Tax=Micromonospora haikouensis TaxID=686309 RepID=UPI00379E0F85